MTADPAPSFVPLPLRCQCGHEWDDWQPNYCRIPVWIAAIRALRCPQCGERRRLYLRGEVEGTVEASDDR